MTQTAGRDDLAARRVLAAGTSADTHSGAPELPPRAPDALDALEARREAAAESLTAAASTVRVLQRRLSRGAADAAAEPPAAQDRLEAAADRVAAAGDRLQAARFLHRSHRDRLTGTLSRDAGDELLQQELDRAQRETLPLTVAFVDLDGLKRINDTQGHQAGDDALRVVGASLLRCLRSYDVVIRYGGDEFVCALPSLNVDEAVQRFADVSAAIEQLRPGTTVSVGLAQVCPEDAMVDVLRRADEDLYQGRWARVPSRPDAPDVVQLPD